MTTNARTVPETASHFYLPNGDPFYEVPYADKKRQGQMRKATLADARKVGAMPSVTTILRCLDKPQLTAWLIEQACLSVLTAPKLPGETLDAFVERVLHQEEQQHAEAEKARELGTAIHDALEAWFTGQDVPEDLRPWIEPAARDIGRGGDIVAAEKVLVNAPYYGGRTDLIQETSGYWLIWDWKSTKKLPERGAWTEHILQGAAYAEAFRASLARAGSTKPIRTANCYISTTEQGKYCVCEHAHDWARSYQLGFAPLVQVWQYLNNYYPGT